MDGVILFGSGLMKDKFHQSNLLDERLKTIILSNIKINVKYKDGFNDAIGLAKSVIIEYKMTKERILLQKYFDRIEENVNNNKYNYCYGLNDSLCLLRCKLIDTLILSHDVAFGLNVILLKNKNNSCDKSVQLFVSQESVQNNKKHNKNKNKNRHNNKNNSGLNTIIIINHLVLKKLN